MNSELESGLLLKCKLLRQMINSEANKSRWGNGGKRGGFDYKPPYGWVGIGLNVWEKYDSGNNDWLAKNGNRNEWAVAYANASERTIKFILEGGFRVGLGQFYANDDDIYHPGNKVGEGVYCSPNADIMEEYSREYIEIGGKKYKMGLMVRVKPDKIRCSSEGLNYWVLNSDEIRPYRILLKEIK